MSLIEKGPADNSEDLKAVEMQGQVKTSVQTQKILSKRVPTPLEESVREILTQKNEPKLFNQGQKVNYLIKKRETMQKIMEKEYFGTEIDLRSSEIDIVHNISLKNDEFHKTVESLSDWYYSGMTVKFNKADGKPDSPVIILYREHTSDEEYREAGSPIFETISDLEKITAFLRKNAVLIKDENLKNLF